MDDDEDAPIPVISPLETASAPLEKLIEDGRTKVESVDYLNRCETPKYSQLYAFNESYVRLSKVFFSFELLKIQVCDTKNLYLAWNF